MRLEENVDSALETIDIYVDTIYSLSMRQLVWTTNGWSMGQLCNHLITDSNYYLQEIHKCIATDDNMLEKPTEEGRAILDANEFPDVLIEGAPSNSSIEQPCSKDELLSKFSTLKNDILVALKLTVAGHATGKTKHPGLGFFSAQDWFRFLDIHLRHHLRQRKRILQMIGTSEDR